MSTFLELAVVALCGYLWIRISIACARGGLTHSTTWRKCWPEVLKWNLGTLAIGGVMLFGFDHVPNFAWGILIIGPIVGFFVARSEGMLAERVAELWSAQNSARVQLEEVNSFLMHEGLSKACADYIERMTPEWDAQAEADADNRLVSAMMEASRH